MVTRISESAGEEISKHNDLTRFGRRNLLVKRGTTITNRKKIQ
jgi:hypothetical protein